VSDGEQCVVRLVNSKFLISFYMEETAKCMLSSTLVCILVSNWQDFFLLLF
jgi:hypothetical protein